MQPTVRVHFKTNSKTAAALPLDYISIAAANLLPNERTNKFCPIRNSLVVRAASAAAANKLRL